MNVIQIRKSLFAKLLGVSGIVIYPFIFFADENPEQIIVRHEMIHVNQIKKYGIIGFYFSYLKEYLQNRLRGLNHNDAYLAISFEKEAYENQHKIT